MKILLCIGGRVYGKHAAGFVGRLSKDVEIDCTVLYVNPEARTFRAQKFPTPRTKEEIDGFIGEVVHILKTGGVEKVRTVIRDGEPTHEILKELRLIIPDEAWEEDRALWRVDCPNKNHIQTSWHSSDNRYPHRE